MNFKIKMTDPHNSIAATVFKAFAKTPLAAINGVRKGRTHQ